MNAIGTTECANAFGAAGPARPRPKPRPRSRSVSHPGPASRQTAARKGPAVFTCPHDCLVGPEDAVIVDPDDAVIVDVEATRSIRQAGIGTARTMIDRVEVRHGPKPTWLTAATATAVQAGPLATYGRLYDGLDWGANMIDPGPIRDVLRAHTVEHSAVDGGEVGLGVEMIRRKFHSIVTLSAETGMDRRHLSRLLQKTGPRPDWSVGRREWKIGLSGRGDGNLLR